MAKPGLEVARVSSVASDITMAASHAIAVTTLTPDVASKSLRISHETITYRGGV